MDRTGILMDAVPRRASRSTRRATLRRSLERARRARACSSAAPALKFGFIFVKFFGFFISVAAYSLWFHSWTFALGFVLMILVHELGHVAEARRQGLKVSWPTFIPFIGAYVTIEHAGLTPWRNALISLAGPFAGGAAAAVVWAIGSARGSTHARRAREHRVPAQRVQHDPDRLPRRRADRPRGARGVAHAA